MSARALVFIIDDGSGEAAEITTEDLMVYRTNAEQLPTPVPHQLVSASVDADQFAALLCAAQAPPPQPAQPSRPRISPREREVLGWISSGLTHGQTATRMGITKATVDTYVERLRRKLGAGNKADLTRAAVALELRDGPAALSLPRRDKPEAHCGHAQREQRQRQHAVGEVGRPAECRRRAVPGSIHAHCGAGQGDDRKHYQRELDARSRKAMGGSR